MSIIIAKILDDRFDIHCDSRITNPNFIKSNPLTGILKSIIINSKICISFAGVVKYAHDAIQEIFEKKMFSVNDLKEYLLMINKNTNNQTDFIISQIEDSGEKKLFRISDLKIEDNIQSTWIGDHEAFRLFQKFMIEDNQFPGMGYKHKVGLVFNNVLKSGIIDTIGDYHIQVVSSKNVFEYNIKMEINVGPQTIHFEKANEWKPISLGTAMNGSFGMSYLVSNENNNYAVGVHFTHGNFGVLLFPSFSLDPIILKDCNGRNFIDIVKENYNITIGGLIRE